ncbi:DUF998 domain-containing protein [Streptomyces tirandamycinicus]|uniref:DUF998 domain-containing protein n=1 Tax=Streptomyces tirandamycinicus TaxID=2174846 RepID=UPI00342AC8CA
MRSSPSPAYAATAEAAIWLSALLVSLLHVLPTPLSPVTDMVCEYALGRFPHLANTSFLAIALAALTLAVSLRGVLPGGPAALTGLAGLVVTALGAAVLPFFVTDPQSPPSSPHGTIHLVAALLSMTSLTVAILALALRFRTLPRWSRLAPSSFVCAGVMAVSLVPMLLDLWPGLTERILIVAGMCWIGMTARHLRTGGPSR